MVFIFVKGKIVIMVDDLLSGIKYCFKVRVGRVDEFIGEVIEWGLYSVESMYVMFG